MMTPINTLLGTGEPGIRSEPSLREQVLTELRSEIVAGRAGSGTIYTVRASRSASGSQRPRCARHCSN